MKKILFTVAASVCITLSAHSQILNGGFENWTSGLPDNWWGALLPPYDLLSQSTAAHSGNYAVKLHIDSLGGQPFGSPLATGDGVITTHPLNFVPLSISFWYQLASVSGDELTMTALVYSGGTGAGVAILAVPAAANYTYVSIPVQYIVIPANADSIAIIFLITHPGGTSHIGTDAYIDDVAVSASTGINSPAPVNSFQITPNPSSRYISIDFPEALNKPSAIFITDVTGRLVYRHTVSVAEKKISIATDSFEQGTYYCTVKSGDMVNRKSFIIIRE